MKRLSKRTLNEVSEKAVGILYLGTSLSLAVFCLYQSQRMSHDQRGRDLAGQSIRLTVPRAAPPSLMDFSKKKIGEGTD